VKKSLWDLVGCTDREPRHDLLWHELHDFTHAFPQRIRDDLVFILDDPTQMWEGFHHT
jgi:hypothetical protein